MSSERFTHTIYGRSWVRPERPVVFQPREAVNKTTRRPEGAKRSAFNSTHNIHQLRSRSRHHRAFVAPLQGSGGFNCRIPGPCPGLSHYRPTGGCARCGRSPTEPQALTAGLTKPERALSARAAFSDADGDLRSRPVARSETGHNRRAIAFRGGARNRPQQLTRESRSPLRHERRSGGSRGRRGGR